MKKIIIVAESGSDIPDQLANQYGLYILPMYVNFSNETLKDGSFPVQKIYEYYQKTKKIPTTSAVNPDDYETLFLQIHEKYPEAYILHLCYSAVTTCTWQNAMIASEGLDYIRHIDTKGVSGGQAVVVLRTAKYLEEHPETSIDEICEKVEDWVKSLKMCFFPGDLVYLVAGGRVSNAAYLGATILSIKPLIEIKDGYLVSGKKFRGSMNSVSKKMLESYLGSGNMDLNFVVLLYSEGLAEEVRKELDDKVKSYGVKSICWVKTGGVISTHGGPGAFGIAGFSK